MTTKDDRRLNPVPFTDSTKGHAPLDFLFLLFGLASSSFADLGEEGTRITKTRRFFLTGGRKFKRDE